MWIRWVVFMGAGISNLCVWTRKKSFVEIGNYVTCRRIWSKLYREVEVGWGRRADNAVAAPCGRNVTGS